MLIEFFLVALLPSTIFGFGKTIYIEDKVQVLAAGGLFEEDSLAEKAFQISIASLNNNRHKNDELPDQFILSASVVTVNNDSYDMSHTVCELTNNGVAAIFGPQDDITSRIVQSMCDTMDIPRIAARWDSRQRRKNELINLYPHSHTLSKVYCDLAENYEWKTFTILYEDTDSLIRMNQLLKRWSRTEHTVTIRQLPKGADYRPILREVKRSGELNIIVECSIGILPAVLKQAHQVGLMSDKHSYIIASLDLQTIDLESYQYGDTNFIGLRLIDPEDPVVVEAFDKNKLYWNLDDPSKLTVEAALVYDGVQLFGRALKQLGNARKADISMSLCDNFTSWEHGSSFMNFMRLAEFRGITGFIKIDPAGYRSNFKLDIMSLEVDGLKKIGVWNSSTGIKFNPRQEPPGHEIELSLRNKTFVVLISLTPPYGMLKESAKMETGNNRYEGFGIDIIHELSKSLGFKYIFREHNSTYGSKDPVTREWNGMIRQLINNQADLAITDLTITADREEAVDFTMPFMNLGISILFTKPKPAGASLFSFVKPYSSEVWLYLIVAYTLTSLFMFVLGRLCPYEWNNPYPCIAEPVQLENQFSFKNALWFCIGTIMQQGSEIAPIGLSTRMMAGSWWFFCLIIVQSYTANLAACLVIESKEVLIKNVQDLANNQHGIKYGAKESGSTIDFFKASTDAVHSKIYQYMMENKDEVLLKSNDEGVNKVLEGKYAYFMESATIAYEAERKCDLDQVGSLLDNKGYGIAMKKHSKYRQSLSTAILKLQETGVLKELERKWWKQNRGGGSCAEEKATSDQKPLGTENVGGVFVVLIGGIVISCFFTAIELIWEVGCTAVKKEVSFKEEIIEELKFAVKCNASTKPVRRRKGSSTWSIIGENQNPRNSSPSREFGPTVMITTTPEGT